MSLSNTTPLAHSPVGCSDTLDGTSTPPGAMSVLQNLIPDPTTRNVFYCRPGATTKTSFGGFTAPGFVSALKVIGTIAYGMISTTTFAGKDAPFVYDLAAGAFIAVTGATALNTPNSPGTTGEWTPPTMAKIGVYMIVTHPGFSGGAGAFFGWLDLTNPAAPVWNAGNTTVNPLVAVPVAVAEFNGRAYYAVNSATAKAVVMSDPLAPLVVTLATQVLTMGNNVAITALAGLPLATQLIGGVIQALIVFQGAANMYQITGDPATLPASDLAINALNIATGTFAPNTITTTPYGLAFVSPQGLRILSFQAQVSDPIGTAGEGITVPFIYSEVPSRMCAAYNNDVLRITTKNASAIGSPWQEWWYHSARKCWTGPHTSAGSLIQPYLNAFLMTLQGVNAKLFVSNSVQAIGSVFTENSVALTWAWQTSLLPDTGSMYNNAMQETLLRLQYAVNMGSIIVTARNENGAAINSVTITPTGAPTIWGAFIWGAALWAGSAFNFTPRQIPWTIPIVFECLAILAQGNSIADFRIGNLWMRYEALGYLQVGQQP